MGAWSLGQEDPLEKGMATHCSILAWRILRTEEPARLQSMGSQRLRHDWRDFPHMHITHAPGFPASTALWCFHYLCFLLLINSLPSQILHLEILFQPALKIPQQICHLLFPSWWLSNQRTQSSESPGERIYYLQHLPVRRTLEYWGSSPKQCVPELQYYGRFNLRVHACSWRGLSRSFSVELGQRLPETRL